MQIVPVEVYSIAHASLVGDVISSTTHYPKRFRDEQIRLLLDSVGQDEHYVAKINGRVAGFLWGYLEDDVYWLAWVGVKPEFRRQGVATRLLKAVERVARRKRAHQMWTGTIPANDRPAAMLIKNGYRCAGLIPRHWYNLDCYIWYKHF